MKTRATMELLAVIEQMPAFDFVGDLPGCRKMIDDFLLSARDGFAHPDVVTEERRIPGRAGAPEVPVLIYRPRGATGPLPALLDIHGGGYVAGIAIADEPGNIRTAHELGCVVVAPDYRLSPEVRAPAAVEDCYAALAWMHQNADELGIDRSRVAIGGASAGGGLAAATACGARPRGISGLLSIADLSHARRPHQHDPRRAVCRRGAAGPRHRTASPGPLIWGRSDGVSAYAAPARTRHEITGAAADLYLRCARSVRR